MSAAGATVQVMRQAVDLSLRDLAKRAGVSPAYLSQVERGHAEPGKAWLRQVTDALGERVAEGATAAPARGGTLGVAHQ